MVVSQTTRQNTPRGFQLRRRYHVCAQNLPHRLHENFQASRQKNDKVASRPMFLDGAKCLLGDLRTKRSLEDHLGDREKVRKAFPFQIAPIPSESDVQPLRQAPKRCPYPTEYLPYPY